MKEAERITKLLEAGNIIRVIDGRCDDGFVDTKTLDGMIKLKMVKVIRKQGMKFVKALPAPAESETIK